MSKKNETKVVCPNCGCEIAIPESEHFTAGMCIGKDSGLGTVVLPAANNQSNDNMSNNSKSNKMNANEKIAALKAAGVNVENLFAMSGVRGDGYVAKMENGEVHVLQDDDPIFKAIMEYGAIPERRLFRRWISAQLLHAFDDMNRHPNWYGTNFVEWLQRNGYEYQWKVLLNELKTQAKLYQRDPENFVKYNRSFSRGVVVAMMKDYVEKLRKHIEGLNIRMHRNRPYKTIYGHMIHCDEIDAKLFKPLTKSIKEIGLKNTPAQLYNATKDFHDHMIKMAWGVKICPAFVDAYKFNGAFFLMENFILFSNCFLFDDYGCKLSKAESLKLLYKKAEEYKNEGCRMFGLMRKFLDDNNIDPMVKFAEWRKAKNNRH